jgi:hypothetical protein
MRCACISCLSIHLYMVSLLTPRYLQISFIDKKKIARGYVVTKSLDDFGLVTGLSQAGKTWVVVLFRPTARFV